jgi:DNA-binding NarL/FixJ family response regulator
VAPEVQGLRSGRFFRHIRFRDVLTEPDALGFNIVCTVATPGRRCERERFIEQTMTLLRVLVVDDSEVIRRGVCTLLEGEPELRVVSMASDGLEAVEQAREQQPDVILLDISLPRLNGIEAARRIRRVAPESKILFLSQYDTWATAREALKTGAAGYVVKSDAASDLISGVWSVFHGKSFVSSTLLAHDLRRSPR